MADLRCDDALADIARVMAQRPAQSPDLISDYYRRGVVECEQGRLDLGLADYNRALAMQARAPAVLAERGLVYLTQGDLDKAASDLRQAISLAPQDDGSIYDYACLEVVRGGMSHFAQRDLQEIVDKKRKVRGVESSYLLLWVLKAGDGEEAAATVELATYLDDDSFPKSTWARDLGAFLVGRMSERELLAATRSPNPIKERVQLCRAWYFIGVKRRLGGDLAGAATAFHHCVAQDERYWEYDLFARTELAHGLNHLSPLDRALSVLQRSLPREGPSPGVLTLFVVSASAGFLLIGGVFVSALWPERSRLHSTPPPSQPEL
jgi:lipoprotein NlpI